MGGSSWSSDLYADRVSSKAAKGVPTFAYDSDVKSGKAARKAHDKLNVHGVNRESRDSDAHPDSVAIGVFFDVTGSMGGVPRVLQQKLPKLMDTLLQKNYCKDPQILVGAVGDYYSDTTPLQAGQFESGIEIDEDLTRLFLEGGGGGTFEESYQNALYFFARHTSTDCWEKRGKKGFLFLIGDEKPYGYSSPEELLKVFGDKVQEKVSVQTLVKEVQEKYNLFFIIPGGTSYYNNPELKSCWEGLLDPEHVIMLKDPGLVCETIGSIIGMFENSLSLDVLAKDMVSGSTEDALVLRNALQPLTQSAALAKAGKGNLPATAKDDSTIRL